MRYPNEGPPLILCPAGLKSMWDAFNERFALGAAVVSHSMIAAPAGEEFDEELGRYIYAAQPGRGIYLEQTYPNRGRCWLTRRTTSATSIDAPAASTTTWILATTRWS